MLKLLHRCLILLTLIGPLAGAAQAQTGGVPGLGEREVDAIRAVISRQMDAFKRDDAFAAFGFAAPSIQKMFGTPERFMTMVRRGYQPVYRPRSVAFRKIVTVDGKLVQPVFVVGPDGVPVTALYIMERQNDGEWRIAGCVLAQPEEQGT